MTARTRRVTPILAVLVLGVAFDALLLGAGQKPILREKAAVPLGPISVHGHVRTPDGRPLQGVTLTLYSSAGELALDMNASTNQAGFYYFAVAKTLVGRTFQLTPSHPLNPSGPFSPAGRVFGLTEHPGPLDFSYTGPLPDLSCPQANLFFEMEGESRHYYIQVTVLNRFNDGKGLAAGPFKVRATYEDRTVNPWKMREVVFPVSGLAAGLTLVEGHLSIGLYPPQAFFRLVKVEVDIEDAVVEGNEGNNTRTF